MRSLVPSLTLVVLNLCGCGGDARSPGGPKVVTDPQPTLAAIDFRESDFEPVDFDSESEVRYALDHAANSDFAVVFVRVDWALLEAERELFQRFARTYAAGRHEPYVGFHEIDFTPVDSDYAPLAELNGWAELRQRKREDDGGSPLNGYGEVVWLDHGQVIDVKPIRTYRTASELAKRTVELFSQ